MKRIMMGMIIALYCLASAPAWALEVYLINGDKITGIVTKEDNEKMVLKTLSAGDIVLDKAYIDRRKTYPAEYGEHDPNAKKAVEAKVNQPTPKKVVPTVVWKKTLTAGYTQTGGNTKTDQENLSFLINRKTNKDESTLKFDSFYSSTNEKIDAKKFYGMARYAYSFGKGLKWYDFYKLEGDQDRFAQIDYRLTPSVGRGYWFSNSDDLKAMSELAIGYEYTNYRTETKSQGNAVLIPHFFVDKRLIGKMHVSEDLTLYPSLARIDDYRLRSESTLTNPINDHWSFKTQLIDEFNSQPIGG